MDFSKLKEHANKLKQQAQKAGPDIIVYSSNKLAESSFLLKNIDDIRAVAKKSQQKTMKTDDGSEKTFNKRSIILFVDAKSDFFKMMLVHFPVLQTKAFAQNLIFKMADINTKDLSLKDFSVANTPALVVYENEKILKVLEGEEKIQKLVKDMNLDINTTINEL